MLFVYMNGTMSVSYTHLETLALDMVSMPGCMSPTEIVAADKAGADFIKLFPAGTLGIKYCKDIYAPLHHVKYIATVGVTERCV